MEQTLKQWADKKMTDCVVRPTAEKRTGAGSETKTTRGTPLVEDGTVMGNNSAWLAGKKVGIV